MQIQVEGKRERERESEGGDGERSWLSLQRDKVRSLREGGQVFPSIMDGLNRLVLLSCPRKAYIEQSRAE